MKNAGKLLFVLSVVLGIAISSKAQNVGINSTGNVPNSSAMLDVSATNKGLLIPNVELTGTTNAGPITSPAVSLLVYNIATTGDVTPGFYYNSGSTGFPVWTKLLTNVADGSETKVTAGTNLTITGIGTTASPYVVGRSPGTNQGDIQYWNGTAWVMVTVGQPGQLLLLSASGIPVWTGLATLTTTAASSIAETTATSGGNITSDGGASVTVRGVCWNTSANPTIANSKTTDAIGTGSFTSNISGLTLGTTYYLRAYATNNVGTAYGNEITFKTLAITYNSGLTYGKMTDNYGNEYKTITIGTQTWMAENLKTTKYRNGEEISNVTDDAEWADLATSAYCWYNNDPANKAIYGGIYNWHAVADSRNIAPVGWHVATDADWTTLTTFLGSGAGLSLREAGTGHWNTPNTDASNSVGFTALPGGYRYGYDGAFHDVGYYGYWWSSTVYNSINAWVRYLIYYSTDVTRLYGYKSHGYSVRCVRD
jgi:uncharacterized protein (TIGR02145 family)